MKVRPFYPISGNQVLLTGAKHGLLIDFNTAKIRDAHWGFGGGAILGAWAKTLAYKDQSQQDKIVNALRKAGLK